MTRRSAEREILRHAMAGIVVCRADRIVTYASPHAVHLLGAEALGQDLAALVAPAAREALVSYLARLAAERPSRSAHHETRSAGAPARVLEALGVNRLGDPSVRGLLLTLADVTVHHERLAAMKDLATRDALTGLVNQAVFHDRLRQIRRQGVPGVLAVLDLDHFKAVNDRHGHRAGDDVLIEVARRMERALRAHDAATVARIGGEEFGVLLPGMDLEVARGLVSGLLDAIAVPQPMGVVTASAGVAPIPGPDAFRRADAALYAAKEAGRNRMVVHTPELLGQRLAAAERIQALQQENAALAREARTDPLTGLPNRRRFEEDLAAADATARRSGRAYAVVFIDLDDFGVINKEWEDAAGDGALRAAAEALASVPRLGDAVYRLGGEEFVALIADATRDEAAVVAGRMRDALRGRDLPHPTLGRLTASFGIAALDPGLHADPAAVVAAASAAMRRAKSGGKDRVVEA